MGVEWVDGDPDDVLAHGEQSKQPREDIVEQGSDRQRFPRLVALLQRRPSRRQAVALGAVAAAGLALAVGLTRGPHRPLVTAQHQPAPATEQVAMDDAVAMIEAAASSAVAPQTYLRNDSAQGACRLVPIGHSPQTGIRKAVARDLPTYTVRDTALTIDQFTALCAISVRAVDAQGSVLVVQVTAPQVGAAQPFMQLAVGVRNGEHGTVSVATAITQTGWSIVVGVVGPLADEPSSADLQRLSQDGALLW